MSESLCDCPYCAYPLTAEHIGGDCPRCGEAAEIEVECEHCGYQPDDDALLHGIQNGYCPKCGGEWSDYDDDGECPECEAELTERDEEEGFCGDCGCAL
ncbi:MULTISPECIES: hypothetical protein [unclassified Lysobacter]|uniref:hypothetical protein n=1 Tax=unclassified Lysobacter TaxID=2635362 RepID=UPI0006F2B63F|nr:MULTISPECIES: hypothetical protein [unclassified Lysobacter]KRC33944.1 hypothetical protein ASE10_13490 [Lysobacter sp. Root76]KRD69278.1 hypothetical protein ASE45_08930 [Lysobacter sp. Root96]